MDLEKDHFDDEQELSGLEDDEEMGGHTGAVEIEEEELTLTEEEPEEVLAPTRPASKPAAAKKRAPKKAKKAKKAAKKAKPKARRKAGKKAAKRKKRR